MPSVVDQCTAPGKATAKVTWSEVYAKDAGKVAVDCADSGDGKFVSTTGGVFGIGTHTVKCTATNEAGCTSEEQFTFKVIGEGVMFR